jgi:hypothetical protein
VLTALAVFGVAFQYFGSYLHSISSPRPFKFQTKNTAPCYTFNTVRTKRCVLPTQPGSMEQRFIDLCNGYAGISRDKIDFSTLWSLILPQAKVLFSHNGESSYQFYLSKLTSENASIWELFLAAGILLEHYFICDEWKSSLIRDYCSFLCNNFSQAPLSFELIERHYFLTDRILGNEDFTSDLYFSFFGPFVNILLNYSHHPWNLFHWFSRVFAIPRVATFLATSELDILTAIIKRIQTTTSELKSDVTKLLVMPYIELMVSANGLKATTLQDIWINLCLEFQKSGDLHVASIIGCKIVDHLSDSSEIGINLPGIWNLIFELLNDAGLVLRKRGAHVMQLYTIYSIKSNLELKSSSWCQSYLEVYRQLEGCSTIHLVSQVCQFDFCRSSFHFRFGMN